MKNLLTPSLTALLLAAGLAVGCDQGAGDTAGGDAASAVGDAMEKGKDAAGDAMDKGEDAAGDAMDKGKDAAEGAMEKGKDMADSAVEKGKDMAADALSMDAGQIDGLLDKVKDLINGGDTEGASGLLSKLDGIELPAGYQEKVDSVKALLEKAKSAGSALQGLTK